MKPYGELFWWFFATILVLDGDVVTTDLYLSVAGSGAEGNPLTRVIWCAFGGLGLVVSKCVLFATIIPLVFWSWGRSKRDTRVYFLVFIGVYGIVVLWNLYLWGTYNGN